jgi:thermitase
MVMKNLVLISFMIFTVTCSAFTQDEKIPNDPYFKYQVSFKNPGSVKALPLRSNSTKTQEIFNNPGFDHSLAKAWGITTGSKKVIVAIIEDGFCYNHEDVRGNIWENPGETGLDANGIDKAVNGKDDDGNGYIDDVMGYDFAFDDPDPDPYIFDGMRDDSIKPNWHGIEVMGIIGAEGNNSKGIAGVNWNVSMMLLKAGMQGQPSKERTLKRIADTAKAIRYAADNGAKLVNWSGYVNSTDPEELQIIKDAIDYAGSKGTLIIAAAGNSAKNRDLDENYAFPVAYEAENLLTVAEVDFNGKLYKVPEGSKWIGGSDYGKKNVDIAAIAQNFTTMVKYNRSTYCLGGGTSCAAPLVTGVAALVLSVRPTLSGLEVKEILMASVDMSPELKGKIVAGGTINAYKAITLALTK